MTRDKISGWHHHLHGHEFEQTVGGGEGQFAAVNGGAKIRT